jgi:hypothetical protein
MLLWGAGVAMLGLFVVFLNHVISPQLLLYTTSDERFTGVSWSQIQQLNPKLGIWLALFYDTTALMMIWYGFLTSVVAVTAYRRGERWPWISLLVSFLISSGYLLFASAPFFSRAIVENSGISVGIVGVLTILAFLVVGLILPGVRILREPVSTLTARPKGSRKLSFGWLAMLIAVGILNIAAAIGVPVTDHLSLPLQPVTYMASDAAFSGVPWRQITTLSPALGLWIVLQMDNMCARMIGGGVLASAISVKGFRQSERWAYYGLLAGSVIYVLPSYLISVPFYQAGIFEPSAVSFGLPPDPGAFFGLLFFAIPFLALVLPISHFRHRIKPENSSLTH